MQLSATPQRAAERGYSLIEVMVAVVVICVGLLGIAKMQSLALSNSNISRQRSLAAFEAAALAAAMHSNRAYWGVTPAGFTATVTLTTPVPAVPITSSDATLQAQASANFLAGPAAGNGATGLNACVGTLGSGPVCETNNYMNLAAYDLARWAYSLQGLLPNPQAFVSCPAPVGAAPTSCTIKITWSENAVGMTQNAAQQQATGANTGQAFITPTYVLYVEP